ncbi:hypothetical protein AERO_03165 [Aeromicrobium fastidiosum]|uniref:hypothetical protein n=1 Tax=Aeromicrobium fastidiosum TaxID=52699 RepID=UPI00202357E7|nr:hypothetical protein [Aeromicrobium fastidiosum]MCL8250371.1 hypothetical protein [Aeromicrobium fastidiosum]
MKLEQSDVALAMNRAQALAESEALGRSDADLVQSDESSLQCVNDLVLAMTSATGLVRTVRAANGGDG